MVDHQIEMCLREVFTGSFLSATISSPREHALDQPTKITIRPVIIKSKTMYQITEYRSQKTFHINVSLTDCESYIRAALLNFRQAVFSTSEMIYQVLTNNKGKTTVMTQPQQASSSQLKIHLHNREKNYLLQDGVPVPFLVKLGIMSSEGKVIAKKYDKFRQINRFLEMVKNIVGHLPKADTSSSALKIIDFGCGKAYLTFALYHYLRHVEQRHVNMVGLDLKKEVIAQCQDLADELGCEGLSFVVGDINQYERRTAVDLVVCLHACDTATDAALEKAIQWNTRVILCVPCCQHELYSQVQCDSLSPLLRHGILRERFAALATDAARAELLTMVGYDVGILEFIDMEHTPKNLLLRAIKSPSDTKRVQAEKRYQPFKQLLKITPSLERCLKVVEK